ncbi:hypothetical protein DE146DRAFT_768549 [Phaeosphaeria sp. MPI-PUGE-AT-0046c]|nr:hypothetical protein DE146DRAFT_768549 [Phaeosphaeria sp. MPI-PUGE-AT-0046c]
MASTNDYDVHLGFWTNWSHGKIQGATVTLTRQNGNLLIAFLAIFIGMVGKSFWRLGCFMLHRHFSSSNAQDGLHHQRQVILRNSDTAQDGAWRLLMSMLAWRSGARARRPILRLLPIIVIAFAISAAFGVASVFSSNVTNEALNQVLLKGSRCSAIDQNKGSVYNMLTRLLPYHAEKATKFLNYGMQCYTNESQTDGCNKYIKPRLNLYSTRGIACPFGDSICKSDNDNLMMDTGFMDSLEDLGINTVAKDRFQLRMVHMCAPLKTEGYTEDYNDTEYGAVKRYKYGGVRSIRANLNFTHEVHVNNAYLPGENDGSDSTNIPRLDYQIGQVSHYAIQNESDRPTLNRFSPIPALHLADADLHMAFLSAPEIRFAAPVKDPWFSAQTGASALHNIDNKNQKFDSYVQDEPASVMACTYQVQYCNPNLPEDERCEPLRGLNDPRRKGRLQKIFPEDSHFATISWANGLWNSGIYTMSGTLGYIGVSALRARYSLSYGYSGPLPDNQWQLEAEHWVKAELASIQDSFVQAANGFPEELNDFRDPPASNDTVAQNMCVNQKIVSTRFSSFNVLGLSLILTLGIIITILDIGLEPFVAWCQRRKYRSHCRDSEDDLHDDEDKVPHPLYGAIEWSQNNMLQLQRLAHEEAGYGEWSKCDRDVPVTEPGQLIARLHLANAEHPMLERRKETPEPRWDEVVGPMKPWGIRRSDTGMETLVEDGEVEKEGKTIDMEENPLPGSLGVHAIGEREGGREHEVQGQARDTSGDEQKTGDWRALR